MAKVVTAAGDVLPLFDAGGTNGRSTQYSNFLLQSVVEARMEKQQIVETFGDPYIFFFGEQPRFIDVTAVLLNSNDFNWLAEWWSNYDNYLRGTKLVEMGARMYLFYDDVIVEGYMLMSSTNMSQDMPLFATLSFRMFVTNYSNVSLTGNDYYPVRASAALYTSVDLGAGDSGALLTPADPSQAPSQQLLSEQAFLGFLGQTAGVQLSQEQRRVGLQQGLTAAQQSIAANQALASSSPQGFGGGGLLVAMLQRGLRSTSFPAQDVQGFIDNVSTAFGAAMQSAFGGSTPDPNLVRTLPIRGKITDNTDEYLSWAGADGVNPPTVSNPVDQSAGVNSPVGGDVADPIAELSDQTQALGGTMTPQNFYNFGMVPYSPGQGFVTPGAFGRPSGAGGGAGTGAGVGLSGGVGLGYYAGAAGGVGLGGTDVALNALRSGGGSAGFFGGAQGSQGAGVVPGVGFGFGQNYGAGFSASFGYTASVGGSVGGGLGGSFGPGIGGGLGGWGSSTYGNPQAPQAGNPLVQNFLQSPYGQPTGTPFGLPVTVLGPNTQSVYAYTGGIAPNGRLQTSAFSGSGLGFGAGAGGGFGSVNPLGPPVLFDGGPSVAAVASLGSGIQGGGAFGVQAIAGTMVL